MDSPLDNIKVVELATMAAATLVTQKCVEVLGPLGYSRDTLVEKWMRDCKVTDIFEGTGQIMNLN